MGLEPKTATVTGSDPIQCAGVIFCFLWVEGVPDCSFNIQKRNSFVWVLDCVVSISPLCFSLCEWRRRTWTAQGQIMSIHPECGGWDLYLWICVLRCLSSESKAMGV